MLANQPDTREKAMNDEELYSLVEIAEMLGTPSTTIRYRAKLFQEFMHPLRRPSQFRGIRYPASDLPIFQLVDGLYKQERSTGDIRRALEEARDGKVIDMDPEAGKGPLPVLHSNGPDVVAEILREGITRAMGPINESNRHIAQSLDSLHELLSKQTVSSTDGGELQALLDRIAELERRAEGATDVPRLRERVRALEDENDRLRDELDRARASIPRRILRRATDLF